MWRVFWAIVMLLLAPYEWIAGRADPGTPG
jgi:hypothetical protein